MTDADYLITPQQKELLVSYLDEHVKSSGFYDKIIEKIKQSELNENSNVEEVYKEIYTFMTNNMPQNVQDAFFEDIRRICPESK